MAASMMFHLTPKASAYIENGWFWVADHDIDDHAQTQIDIYAGRGVLIESQSPTWILSCSSEHSTLYNWQLSKASNIFLAQIQSETAYFQHQPRASAPYNVSKTFSNDPEFPDCVSGSKTCEKTWALRIIESRNIFVFGLGFYSFFKDYEETCVKTFDCQDRLIDTSYSQGIWLYEIYTVGAREIVSPQG
jgi:hypothetical protein